MNAEIAKATVKLIRGQLGDGHRVDMTALRRRLDELDDGRVMSSTASILVANLRRLADDLESEVLALRDSGKGLPELEDGEAELFEGSVAELRKLGVVHHASRRVRVVDRILGVLLGSARRKVSGAHSSPSIGSVDVPPSAVSDPIVGDAPGAAASPTAHAPGAPSGGAA